MATRSNLVFSICQMAVCGLLLSTTSCRKEAVTPAPAPQETAPQPATASFSRQFVNATGDSTISQASLTANATYEAKRLPDGLTVLLTPETSTAPEHDFESMSLTIPTALLVTPTAGTGTYPLTTPGIMLEYRYGRQYSYGGFTFLFYKNTAFAYTGTITITKYSKQYQVVSGSYEVGLTNIPSPLYRFGDRPTPQKLNATLKGVFTDLKITRF